MPRQKKAPPEAPPEVATPPQASPIGGPTEQVAAVLNRPRPAEPEAERVHHIALGDIVDEVPNRPVDAAAVERMAESIARSGQEVPITVHELPADGQARPRYQLGDGQHRLRAMIQLGRATIAAYIRPEIDAAELHAERARLNLDRAGATPMDEVLIVTQMMAQGLGTEAVAAMLGRSESWVQDRAYLVRLHAGVQTLVRDGLLLLGHARELAKVGDLDLQCRIAQEAVSDSYRHVSGCGHGKANDGGTERWTITQLRARIEQEKRRLDRVPWKLELKVAGVRACAGCDHNTATDKTLFGISQGDPEQGCCLNPTCFERKTALAEKQKSKDAAKLAKQPACTTAAAQKVAAPWIKPAAVVREARKLLSPQQKAAETTRKDNGVDAARAAMREAKGKWDKALDEWEDKQRSLVLKQMDKNPMLRLAIFLAEAAYRTDPWSIFPYDADPPKPLPRLRPVNRALVHAIVDMAGKPADPLSGITLLREWLTSKAMKDYVEQNIGARYFCHEGLEVLVASLHPNIAIDPIPRWESFAPAPGSDTDNQADADEASGTSGGDE